VYETVFDYENGLFLIGTRALIFGPSKQRRLLAMVIHHLLLNGINTVILQLVRPFHPVTATHVKSIRALSLEYYAFLCPNPENITKPEVAPLCDQVHLNKRYCTI